MKSAFTTGLALTALLLLGCLDNGDDMVGDFAPQKPGSVWKYSYSSYSGTRGYIYGTYSLTLLETIDGKLRFHYQDSMQPPSGPSWSSNYKPSENYFKQDTVILIGKADSIMGKPSPFAPSAFYPRSALEKVQFQGQTVYQLSDDEPEYNQGGYEGHGSLKYVAGIGLVKKSEGSSSRFGMYDYNEDENLIEYRAAP